MDRNVRDNPVDYTTLKRDFIAVNVTSGAATGIMLLVMILQRQHIVPGLPCGVHDIFRIYCPGCGGTRALFELLKGNLLQSLIYNPAILLGAILIAYYEIGVMITLIKKKGKRYYKKNGLVYGYLIILAVFAIARDYLLVGMGIDVIGDFL